ncbi:MAG: RdgB/HAM1 family non-canonical purine NTP pyrophosphatase [Leptospira sp.]|nr:RdgB/HAM1 family non-canonical purine NTP pyrophosphatase [Leptospira sp.]
MQSIIAIATANLHKVTEIRSFLNGTNITIKTPLDLNIKWAVEETGTTFEENANLKSKELFRLSGLPSLADDSGICVHALGDSPGVYSAMYGKEGMTDRERALFLLEQMKNISDRSAYFQCILSFTDRDGTRIFEGRCNGEIANDYDETGEGFGYDPVFFYPGLRKRFSMLTKEEKNSVSHRGLALKKFQEFLKNYSLSH